MDPPLKLFGQTIALTTTSASSQDDALDVAGATSSGAWEELSSAPQDRSDSGAESGVKSDLVHTEVPACCGPEISSSGSNGADEEKMSSPPLEVFGIALPLEEASKGRRSEGVEDLDVDEAGFMHGEEVNGDVGGKGGKMPRRPDKAVACPRCHSLETKFCYYNNYNVNQPRHFCKHCQRYWTAGGTLRNVPVGAGRRKNKHGSVVSPRQTPDMGLVRGDEPDVATPLLVGKGVAMAVPLQVPVVQTVLRGSVPSPPKPIGRVPTGGGSSDGVTPLPYGMRVPSLEGTYILTSAEAVKPGEAGGVAGNLPRGTQGLVDVSRGTNEVEGTFGWPSKDESACAPACGPGGGPGGSNLLPSTKGDSAAPPKRVHDGVDVTQAWNNGAVGVRGSHGAPGSFGFYNGGWPYGYNVGWSLGAAFCAGGVATVGNAVPPPTPANVAAWSGAPPGNMWTGVPWAMPGLSWTPAGWGPPPPWPMAPWAMGAAASPAGAAVARTSSIATGSAAVMPSPVACPQGGSPGSSLGKHVRPFDGGGAADGTVWAPKSLRMADPEESMRSSVWRILGGGAHPEVIPASTFKAFQPNPESKKAPDGDQQLVQATLHANPAAMSRSMYFQESN